MKRSKAEYKEYWLFLLDEDLFHPRWIIRVHALSDEHAKLYAQRAWVDFKCVPWLVQLQVKNEINQLIYTLPRKH